MSDDFKSEDIEFYIKDDIVWFWACEYGNLSLTEVKKLIEWLQANQPADKGAK